jgi:hypothetical protein
MVNAFIAVNAQSNSWRFSVLTLNPFSVSYIFLEWNGTGCQKCVFHSRFWTKASRPQTYITIVHHYHSLISRPPSTNLSSFRLSCRIGISTKQTARGHVWPPMHLSTSTQSQALIWLSFLSAIHLCLNNTFLCQRDAKCCVTSFDILCNYC